MGSCYLKHSYVYCWLSIDSQLLAWAHRQSAYIQPLHHSRDELSQALSHFSVLQAMESWAGPGNEARQLYRSQVFQLL